MCELDTILESNISLIEATVAIVAQKCELPNTLASGKGGIFNIGLSDS